MAERYSFFPAQFDGTNYDRGYDHVDFALRQQALVQNGVLDTRNDDLKVFATTNMIIRINPGFGFINGYTYALDKDVQNPPDFTKQVAISDGTFPRIDRVVIRWDILSRIMSIEILQGTPSSSPVPQTLTRNTSVHELAIADIRVNAGTMVITQANITDLRSDETLCGYSKTVVSGVDGVSVSSAYVNASGRLLIQLSNGTSIDAGSTIGPPGPQGVPGPPGPTGATIDALLGEIKAYFGTTVPEKYLLCNGQAVSQTTYADLFAVVQNSAIIIGSNFIIPDLRSRFLMMGSGTTVGSTGGDVNHTHNLDGGNSYAKISLQQASTTTTRNYFSIVNASYTSTRQQQFGGVTSGSVSSMNVSQTTGTELGGRTELASSLPPHMQINYIMRAIL